MSDGKLTSLRPTVPEADKVSGGVVECRFESTKGIVILTTSNTDSPDTAPWAIKYVGELGGAPARESSPGYGERNIMEFWSKLELPDPQDAYNYLCFMRGVDELAVIEDARAEISHDFHFGCLAFMKEAGYSPMQARYAMLLSSDVYESSVGGGNVNSQRGTFHPDRSFEMLKDGIISLSAPKRPHKALLSMIQASALAAFFQKTFYSHYELYVFTYIWDQEEAKVEKRSVVETSMPPLKMTTGSTQ